MRGDGLLIPAGLAEGDTEVVQRCALAVPVAGFPVDLNGGLVRGDGLLIPAGLAEGVAEVVQRAALATPVAGARPSGLLPDLGRG